MSTKLDYNALIKDAEFEVKYYQDEVIKQENKLFRARLGLEALRARQTKEIE